VCLGQTLERALRAVDRARADVQQIRYPRSARQLEHAPRAEHDRVVQLERAGIGRRAGVGGRVDHVAERTLGNGEVAHVAVKPFERRLGRELGTCARERSSRPRQHAHAQAEAARAIGAGERRQQPATEEAGAAGEEQPAVAQRVERALRAVERELEVRDSYAVERLHQVADERWAARAELTVATL
jgi:hypothetical protein